MQQALPLVSVVVPVYRDEERLALCLEALAMQSYPRARTELIVVDNDCDGLDVLAQPFPMVLFTRERMPGSYAARNRGILESKGQILAFTDADCVPTRDWLQSGVAALDGNPNLGAVGGRIEMISSDPAARLSAVDLHERVCGLPQRQFVEDLRFAATANMFSRRGVFDDVGLFASDLKSSGDREWAMRVIDRGYELIYADEVVVRHWARRTLREFVRRRRRITGGWQQVRRSLAAMDPPRQMRIPSRFSDSTARLRQHAGHPLLASSANRLRFVAAEMLLYGTHLVESLRLGLGGRPIRH
jgi:cellulose synthase/poly-beta-1,6-N-acetylglucosamine synthase-like glycosyltransferase